MKKHHTTFVLLILFFTGLLSLWWAHYAEIPTTAQQRELVNRVVPALIDVPAAEIARVEIQPRDGKPIVLERREGESWQMREPIDTAANPSMAEVLVRNVKDLRKSPDAGTILERPEVYGLAPPEATVRLYRKGEKTPLTTLELGKTVKDRRYVRERGVEGIEVVEPRLLGAADRPAADWRDVSLFSIPTFRISGLAVTGPDRDLKAEREEGRWELLRPVRAPADDAKVETVLAEFSSLRVIDGPKGFVADDVKDFAPYGLDKPSMTVELTPSLGPIKSQVVYVGKAVPDHPDRVYARRGDQDDVVMVDPKNFRDVGVDPVALRSQKVADFDLARVSFVRVDAFGTSTLLAAGKSGWQIVEPSRQKADSAAVQSLLTTLNEVKTSEFLDPEKLSKHGTDRPNIRIRIWESEGRRGERADAEKERRGAGKAETPQGDPVVSLRIGVHDALRKAVYARLDGDKVVLALPDTILDALPDSKYAFRDRTVLSLSATQIARLKVARRGRLYELAAPAESGKANQWRMLAPVEARADNESVTRVVVMLSDLHAERFVNEPLGDGKDFGLDSPWLSVSWQMEPEATGKGKTEAASGTLRIGAKAKPSETYYANIAGQQLVFTLNLTTVQPFLEEFHDRRVLSFESDRAERVALRWPDRALSFVRQEKPSPSGPGWKPELGQDISGFDLSRVGPLVRSLAALRTDRFFQYKGSISPATGLASPRLLIDVRLSAGRPPRALRVGNLADEGGFYATTSDGTEGPVFLLAGEAWSEIVKPPHRPDDLPEDVFAGPQAR